ncbi:Tricarboxylate transport sensor protein TctE [Klebsiella michiganensis]|uniref:Tricarboxylate transport sensor protein TctE n=1 Tax=Klebsiella michiganensis TaxID=1134687 RepID=A0A7H4PPD3_9ENTR|nr:Tricarboxylate transport sensor protein TctE [Klebsiella michiganensis]
MRRFSRRSCRSIVWKTWVTNPGAGLGLALVSDIARLHRSHPQLLRSETLGGLKVRLRFLTVGSE